MATMRLATGAEVWVPKPKWTPRVVAVDEDGTFLTSPDGYNLEYFEALWPHLVAHGVHFVVASGNQYWQIRDLFSNHADEIAYVSANGGYVEDSGAELVHVSAMESATAQAIIVASHQHPELPLIMAGVKSAYVERSANERFIETMRTYYHRLALVDDLSKVDDRIIMFSGRADDDDCRAWMQYFEQAGGGELRAVYSGDGYFDLLIPGVSKAYGLAALCKRWGILSSDVAAFGDSENDFEMLKWAGAGYAMSNAAHNVLAVADGIAPANTDDGVLQLLEAWFAPHGASHNAPGSAASRL